MSQMNDNIKTLLTQMETLGEEGKIDESQGLLQLVEGLRKEKAEHEAQKAKVRMKRSDRTCMVLLLSSSPHVMSSAAAAIVAVVLSTCHPLPSMLLAVGCPCSPPLVLLHLHQQFETAESVSHLFGVPTIT